LLLVRVAATQCDLCVITVIFNEKPLAISEIVRIRHKNFSILRAATASSTRRRVKSLPFEWRLNHRKTTTLPNWSKKALRSYRHQAHNQDRTCPARLWFGARFAALRLLFGQPLCALRAASASASRSGGFDCSSRNTRHLIYGFRLPPSDALSQGGSRTCYARRSRGYS
jgi:hypothetical protein